MSRSNTPILDEAAASAEAFIEEAMKDVGLKGDMRLRAEEIIRRAYRVGYLYGMKSGVEKAAGIIEASK